MSSIRGIPQHTRTRIHTHTHTHTTIHHHLELFVFLCVVRKRWMSTRWIYDIIYLLLCPQSIGLAYPKSDRCILVLFTLLTCLLLRISIDSIIPTVYLTRFCLDWPASWTGEVGEVRLEHNLKAGDGRQDRRAATDHHITRYKRGAIGAAFSPCHAH